MNGINELLSLPLFILKTALLCREINRLAPASNDSFTKRHTAAAIATAVKVIKTQSKQATRAKEKKFSFSCQTQSQPSL